jgi:hypothetical protein
MSRVRLVLALAALAACTGAHAQWDETNWDVSEWNEPGARPGGLYADVRGGTFLPIGDDLDTLEMGAGYGGEITLGWLVDPSFALELGAGWYQSAGDELAVAGFPIAGKFSLDVMPVTANARVFLAGGAFRPYLVAGAGAYLVELGVKGRMAGIPLSASDRVTTFGFQGGAGFRAQLGSRVNLVLDAMYRATSGEFTLRDASSGVGLEVSSVDITGVTVSGGLGVDF